MHHTELPKSTPAGIVAANKDALNPLIKLILSEHSTRPITHYAIVQHHGMPQGRIFCQGFHPHTSELKPAILGAEGLAEELARVRPEIVCPKKYHPTGTIEGWSLGVARALNGIAIIAMPVWL